MLIILMFITIISFLCCGRHLERLNKENFKLRIIKVLIYGLIGAYFFAATLGKVVGIE